MQLQTVITRNIPCCRDSQSQPNGFSPNARESVASEFNRLWRGIDVQAQLAPESLGGWRYGLNCRALLNLELHAQSLPSCCTPFGDAVYSKIGNAGLRV